MPKNKKTFRFGFDCRMSAETPELGEVKIYGDIIPDMDEDWKWSKEDKSAADFDREIKKLKEQGARKVLVRINSPGGSCTQAVAMRGILANAEFEEITIRIEGLCASAATDIATLPNAHVQMMEGSEYMIHNPYSWYFGEAKDFENAALRLRGIEKTAREFYMQKTKQDEETIKAWMDKETWFSAKEAKEYGFVDEILTSSEDEFSAVACVRQDIYDAMQSTFCNTPKNIRVKQEKQADSIPKNKEKQKEGGNDMEIKDIDQAQLQQGNPTLHNEIMQKGAEMERARLQKIDALTLPGFEAMAQEAKANGTSAMEFHEQIVQAKTQKDKEAAQAFLNGRQNETQVNQSVKPGTSDEIEKNEDEEILKNANEVAQYAKQYSQTKNGGMF